jgi:hypothetical protein
MGGRPSMQNMELTDERIDGIIRMTKQFDPTKAEEYEKLRETDPEALKAKIREDMQSFRSRMMQGGGPGGFGGRQGQRNRSGQGTPTENQPRQAPEGQNDR